MLAVYQIVCEATGERYVGSSTSIKSRYFNHCSDLRRGKHCNRRLQDAWLAHGPSAFSFSILEECNADLLVKREQFYVDLLNPEFNLVDAYVTHCPKDHEYTVQNTHINKKGKRICRRCAADRVAINRASFTVEYQQELKAYKQDWHKQHRDERLQKMREYVATHKAEKREYDRLRKLRLKLLRSQ